VVPVRTEGRQEKRDPVRMWSLIELTVWVLGVIFRCTVSLSLSRANRCGTVQQFRRTFRIGGSVVTPTADVMGPRLQASGDTHP